jgi:putative membrane protein
MKRIIALSTVLAITFFVLNGVITQASNRDSFMKDAAASGMAEVMLGNLALQKSQNEQVRSFAQQMVADHTAANGELASLAASKSVTLPTEPDAKHKSAMDKLNGLSGTEFDKAFMKQMVKDHEAAVRLFSKEAEKGDDADTKAFAAKTLPTLQNHLQMARTMNDSMKGMKGSNSNSNSNSNRENMNMNSNSGNMNSDRNGNTNRNSNSNNNSNRNSNRKNSNSNSNSNVNRR